MRAPSHLILISYSILISTRTYHSRGIICHFPFAHVITIGIHFFFLLNFWSCTVFHTCYFNWLLPLHTIILCERWSLRALRKQLKTRAGGGFGMRGMRFKHDYNVGCVNHRNMAQKVYSLMFIIFVYWIYFFCPWCDLKKINFFSHYLFLSFSTS